MFLGGPSPPAGWRAHVGAIAAFVVVAIAFAWPLPLHLRTHLTGAPDGDTGVYVWNQWVFQHEVLDEHSLPYFTDEIFSLTRPANLSLHNYTTFQNLIALPLVGSLGGIATFNLVYLLMTVLTAYTTFLLARHVTGRSVESWLAGMLFAWSPVLVTRGAGHFSLVAAAPLAVFMLLLLRALERPRTVYGVALGATLAWSASTDAYYGVYAVIIAAIFLGVKGIVITRRAGGPPRRTIRALNGLLIGAGGITAGVLVRGWWALAAGETSTVSGLHTPMLVLTILAALRLGCRFRLSLSATRDDVRNVTRLVAVAVLTTGLLLSPVFYAMVERIRYVGLESSPVYWRSSPSGVDVASFLLPNPNHPLAPAAIRAWLTMPRADAYLENVASVTFVAMGVMLAAWRRGWRPPRLWVVAAVVFGALALGPFVHLAGINTRIPGPWAFLRYVPVIGLARTPARFSVVLMLALAVLFALALSWWSRREPGRSRWALAVVSLALCFELLPFPRTLYSAEIPRIYERVAAAPAGSRVLELPFGVRDGTSSAGNFTARTQFFQTMHHKRLIGGYLSRVSKRRVSDIRQNETLDALILLSEGQELAAARVRALILQGPAFIRWADISYVVIDRERASDALREFAVGAFDLELVEVAGPLELYRSRMPGRPVDGL